MAKREKEFKSLPVHVVEVDDSQGIVKAIASVMGVIDYGRDVIHNGAYTKTISERAGKIRILDQHNTDSVSRVLGRPIELRELSRDELPSELLAKYPTATGGLLVVIKFNLKTTQGNNAFQSIAEGDLDEYSIGFDALDIDYEERIGGDGKKFTVRNIRSIRLWEVSPVIWGQNFATMTVDVKENNMPEEEQEKQPEGEKSSSKIMDQHGRPIKLLGDYIHGTMAQSFMYLASNMYANGFMSTDEYEAINKLATDSLSMMRKAMDSELASRPISMSYYYEFSFKPVGEVKQDGQPTSEDSQQPNNEAQEPEAGSQETEAPTDEKIALLNLRAAQLTRKLQLFERLNS